jgi:hypothetical protein
MTRTMTVLSQDLRPGDVLISAALGGAWNATLTRVSIHPRGVEVGFGTDNIQLHLNEVCQVRRSAPALLPNPAA